MKVVVYSNKECINCDKAIKIAKELQYHRRCNIDIQEMQSVDELRKTIDPTAHSFPKISINDKLLDLEDFKNYLINHQLLSSRHIAHI